MTRFWLVLAMTLSLVVGCARQSETAPPWAAGKSSQFSKTANQGPVENSNDQLPFKSSAKGAKKGISPTRSLFPSEITVPVGTPVIVGLQSTLSSATANNGDPFDAILGEPLLVNGETVAPRDAEVRGRVLGVEHSGHLSHSGYIRITLSSIMVDGKEVPVHTSSIFVSGGKHKQRNLAMIGGGAGGGALIGGLAGGGKGALIGGLVGAGAGTGAAYATGKKDVSLGLERRLTFRLTQPLTVSK